MKTMTDEQAFLAWHSALVAEIGRDLNPGALELRRRAFLAGCARSEEERTEIRDIWMQVREAVNTPASREIDKLLEL